MKRELAVPGFYTFRIESIVAHSVICSDEEVFFAKGY
jgi:hypothetical protein